MHHDHQREETATSGGARAWRRLGQLLATAAGDVVTGLIFFVVVTPVAQAMKLLGKDALRLKRDSAVASYWAARTPPGPAPDTMNRQF